VIDLALGQKRGSSGKLAKLQTCELAGERQARKFATVTASRACCLLAQACSSGVSLRQLRAEHRAVQFGALETG